LGKERKFKRLKANIRIIKKKEGSWVFFLAEKIVNHIKVQ